MDAFWTQWQKLPVSLDPIAFSFLGLPVSWYALFFVLGGILVYFLARKIYFKEGLLTQEKASDFGFGVVISALIGAKLGFLFLYWYPFLVSSSFDFSILPRGAGLTLPGMSFVGGALGVTLYIHWFSARNKKVFFQLTDILVLFMPVAIFFGRLGNFFQVELPGRVTQVPWGMYFPGQELLRHPSTLYAAFLEGAVLFVFLFLIKKQAFSHRPGFLTMWFCVGYGTLRFFSEFFREPDVQIGYIGVLTLNQIFAVLILIVGLILLSIQKRKN